LKIDLKTLAASGFRLELPNDAGTTDLLGIAGAVGLGGTYVQDARRICLQGFRAETLRLATVEWQLASGSVALGPDTELGAPRVDLDIPRGDAKATKRTRGKLSALRFRSPDVRAELGELGVVCALEASAVAIELGERGRNVAMRVDELSLPSLALRREGLGAGVVDVGARGLVLERGHERTRVELAEATVSKCSLGLGELELQAEGLRFAGIELSQDADGGIAITVAHAVAEGVTVRRSGFSLRAERLELVGLRFEAGALSLDRCDLGHAELSVALDATASRSATPTPEPAPPRQRRKPSPALDVSFLDALDGRVDVDVHVDATVPYHNRRRATHHFRIAVKHGALDYKKLEGDLSALEDALLDFAVRKGQLVLEVSPPLLPFVRKTIVIFPLDERGRELAEKKLVRLATLAAATLPPKKAGAADDPEEAKSFSLDRLDFDPIDVELHLGGGGRVDLGERGAIALGAARRAAVGKLLLRGELHHRAATTAKKPTSIVASAQKVRLGLERIALGDRALSIGELSIEQLDEARVTARGLVPTRLDAKLGALTLRGVRLD
jgi:hypothetical protein